MGTNSSKYKIKSSKHHSYRADRPSPPGKPTLKYDTKQPADPETVTIKWNPPLYDGGSKIIGYLVEHKRTGSPHWVKASPIKVRQTQLTVCGLEPNWRYQFRVSAENEYGLSDPSPLSEPLSIFVHQTAAIAPYFINELDNVLVLENDKVEFSVSFEGVPTPKISWYKDGLEIFSDRCRKISTEGCVSKFFIYQVSIFDESEIKCTATNKTGYAVTKGYLQVQAPPTLRLSRQYEDGLIFEQGESIRLKVSVVGRPEPEIYWYLNGEKLDFTSPRYDVEYANGTAMLKIREAVREDRGEYQIHALNSLGEDVASILVTIANRPQPPNKINVDRVVGQTVSLSWLQPQDDGGCQIGSYIIEYYKTGWNMWLKAGTSRQPYIVLYDLIPASRYKFRVKAENPYGVSDPSPETDNVFIPDMKNNILTPDDITQYKTDVKNFPLYHELEWSPFLHENNGSFERRSSSMPPEKPKRRKLKTPQPCEKMDDIQMLQGDLFEANTNEKSLDLNFMSTSNLNEGGLTPSSELSTNTDDISRTSSELMLVLLPNNEEKNNHRATNSFDGIQWESPNQIVNFIPPPLSLSAPELGSEMEFFKPLQRNCVSSTEILHESTIARFYKELQDQNIVEKMKKQFDSLCSRKPVENLAELQNYFDQVKNQTHLKMKPTNLTSKVREEGTIDTIQFGCSAANVIDESGTLQETLNNLKHDSSAPIGQYCSVNGTFHYPDLFVESLTKSPSFKTTSSFLSDVVLEMTSKKPIKIESYRNNECSQKRIEEIPAINIIDTKPDGQDLYADSEMLDYEMDIRHKASRIWEEEMENKPYLRSTQETILEEESESEENSSDETSSDDTDDSELDEDLENDTYHPNITPLSFEQALAISNPKRSVSPTNDLFLESESLFDEKNLKISDELGCLNRNFDDGLHEEPVHNFQASSSDISRKPKSILKHRNLTDDKIDSNMYRVRANPVLHRQSFGNYSFHKKQVWIEEPGGFRVRPQTGPYEEDASVIVNHYSDIVRQYGIGQKPANKVYMTYDELKAAAEHEDLVVDERSSRDDITGRGLIEQPQLSSSVQTRVLNDVYIIPKTNLNIAQVRYKVHFFFEFFLDIVMFLSACWLYCFKDERLAIPIILLMLYRQLYDRMKSKLSNFKFWRRKE